MREDVREIMLSGENAGSVDIRAMTLARKRILIA